jgi:hypothetical protein
MAYDKELDKVLKEKSVIGKELVVRLVQYDNGAKKIAIVKELTTQHGTVYSGKIGRLDLDVAKIVAKGIVEILREENG